MADALINNSNSTCSPYRIIAVSQTPYDKIGIVVDVRDYSNKSDFIIVVAISLRGKNVYTLYSRIGKLSRVSRVIVNYSRARNFAPRNDEFSRYPMSWFRCG